MSVFSTTEEILNRLDLLDLYCIQHKVEASLVILGASGILLYMEKLNRDFRPTIDIDVNLLESNDSAKLRELLQAVQIDLIGGRLKRVKTFPPKRKAG